MLSQPLAIAEDGLAEAEVLPVSALFCTPDERSHWEEYLDDALQVARETISQGWVAPTVGAEAIRGRLQQFDFQCPRGLGKTIDWVVDQMSQGLVQITHPRYFGLFNPAPSLAAELADRIVAAFNPQLATATTSPMATEVERHVIRAFAERLGFPKDSTGHFATGGSEANCTALICALTHANPAYVDSGIGVFGAGPTFYVSEEAHLAWIKIAVQCGTGHAGLRFVPADERGCMNPVALSDMIAADKQSGRIPVMVAATAGTTGAGMIDPLHACADVAELHGLWYHVDAAWGGAALVSPKMRTLLAGAERAQSVTIDAHKWLATTMACSMLLTRNDRALRHAFFAESAFMPPSDQTRDPHLTTVQWSRRFLGLRLFVSLAAVGWQGHATQVERTSQLAELLKRRLRAGNWEIANDSRLGVVCALPPEGFPPVRDLARAVVASGKAWVSSSSFKGRDVLRICPTNGQTMPHDVLVLVNLLDGFRQTASQRDAVVS
jgi:glutamate/tyrosine decarboxylase-like PLP-dependent enzyme